MTTDVLRLTTPALLLSVAAGLLVGCLGTVTKHPQGGGEPVRVRTGEEFKLRAGGRAALEGEGFGVRFDSVANDSRCPTGVTCVWAGNAEVLIEAESGGAPAVMKLNTHGGENYPKEARHRQYVVTLVALTPHPAKDTRTKAADYEATLVIRKA